MKSFTKSCNFPLKLAKYQIRSAFAAKNPYGQLRHEALNLAQSYENRNSVQIKGSEKNLANCKASCLR